MARRNKTLIELSVQNLIDCSIFDDGCTRGKPSGAIMAVNLKGGIQSAESYPYEGKEGTCRFDKDLRALNIGFARHVPYRNERMLQEHVAKYGPIAVLIDASSSSFKNYKSGIYFNDNCRQAKNALNHAMLVVGYGTDNERGDYWILVSAQLTLKLSYFVTSLLTNFSLSNRKTLGEQDGASRAICA